MDCYKKPTVFSDPEQQKIFDMFKHIATLDHKAELRKLKTEEEKMAYMKDVVEMYKSNSVVMNKQKMKELKEAYDTISKAFDAYKSTEEMRTASVIQNYSSTIAIAIHCKDFTGGAPIPVEGCGVEITIVYEGVGYYSISIVSGMDKIEKYGITEDDLTPYGRDQLYRISGGSLAMMMHDFCMIMHDPKSYYKEV